jgi:hypothetical protein
MITVDSFIEVTLKQNDDFLKVKETLTRIGIASERQILYCTLQGAFCP